MDSEESTTRAELAQSLRNLNHHEQVTQEPSDEPLLDSKNRLTVSSYQELKSTPNIQIPDWLHGEQQLSKSWYTVLLGLLYDLILILAPVLFLVLGFCAIRLHGQNVSDLGTTVLQLQKLAPTIFPIVFAAVVGVFMSTLAHWHADKGCELGLLEQLIGSQSLGSALQRITVLHRFRTFGFLILSLWALSPLGGQSALRVLSTQPLYNATTYPLRYYDNFFVSYEDDINYNNEQYFSLVMAALLTNPKTHNSPMDAWGNVKIPMIEPLEESSTRDANSNSWYTFERSTAVNYSSLSGLMIVGLPDKGVSKFRAHSSYFYLDCSEMLNSSTTNLKHVYDRIKPIEWFNSTGFEDTFNSGYLDLGQPIEFLLTVADGPANGGYPNMYFVRHWQPYAPGDSFAYAENSFSNCSATYTWVEAEIECIDKSCATIALRRDTPPESYTPMNPKTLAQILASFSTTVATKVANLYNFGPSAEYLAGNDGNVYKTDISDPKPFFAHVTPKQFSVRLSQLWNLYTQIQTVPNYVTGGYPSNLTLYSIPNIASPPFANLAATAKYKVPTGDVYVAKWSFVTILLAVTFTLELCALANAVLRQMCKTPDILGYVSSMTRENPYVPLPPGGNTMDGLERARCLDKLWVQVTDVQPLESVGHIELRKLDKTLPKEVQQRGRVNRDGGRYFM